MKNAEFRLLLESMGFYSLTSVTNFLKKNPAHETVGERAVDYWLKGKKNQDMPINEDVINFFLEVKEYQQSIINQEIEKIRNNQKSKYRYIFKNDILMWNTYPEFFNFPVTFLNQIILQINIYAKFINAECINPEYFEFRI